MTLLTFRNDSHLQDVLKQMRLAPPAQWAMTLNYRFDVGLHPFVGDFVTKLNIDGIPGLYDANWQASLKCKSIIAPATPALADFDKAWEDSRPEDGTAPKGANYFTAAYSPAFRPSDTTGKVARSSIDYLPKQVDVTTTGPYAIYNWELFFHIPFAIACHLSKQQRFQEAQRWFHRVFDPTSREQAPAPARFWKFIGFRDPSDGRRIEDVVALLSRPLDGIDTAQKAVLGEFQTSLTSPFQPHAIARHRHIAYQYAVVMKYLDNLIAWGDSLFQQYTVETINEATQLYILAANILGERPRRIAALGKTAPKSFAQLKKDGLGPIGDALVELESQFPANLLPLAPSAGGTPTNGPLFGIGRTLYFAVPPNDKLLSYWDTVGDRLFKIRNGLDFTGVARPLALFDPPIDPALLVKATAAGLDLGSAISGLNQPIGPLRSVTLLQKTLELCSELRGLGSTLLAAIEKGDAEHLALIRQRQEIDVQGLTKEVRFLQLQAAREATKSLLVTRKSVLERLHFYKRALGLPVDPGAPDDFPLKFSPDLEAPLLTQDNFDKAYGDLVQQYDKTLSVQTLSDLHLAAASTTDGLASLFSGGGNGQLYLNAAEDAELNSHLPRARDSGLLASTFNTVATALTAVPDARVDLHFWGLGGTVDLKIGDALVNGARITGEIASLVAAWERDQAGMAARAAGHQRRADEWILQHNLAAHELMQSGRQILSALLAEQVAQQEYRTLTRQIANAQEVQAFFDAVNTPDRAKFSSEQMYLWMQGEASRVYYELYRFAFDCARKLERTMKQELMSPELDAQDFVQFNYWDGGRKGLLSGEALYLDVKRLEMAYHDNNRRELELTKHVSLRQLDPVALLALRASGNCQVAIPEWLFDLDTPGHYMRRIKSVALSLPAVVGPYSCVSCTLSLVKSSVRKSSSAGEDYARQGTDDSRFVDYTGASQSIVTSSAQSDSGLFEANLRDERLLPFEGSGAVSTWRLELPADYRAFDYASIADVVFHIRMTARRGVDVQKVTRSLDEVFAQAKTSARPALFSLRRDFPTAWAAFIGSTEGPLKITLRRDFLPYFTQGRAMTIEGLELYNVQAVKHPVSGEDDLCKAVTERLKDNPDFTLELARGDIAQLADAGDAFLVLRFSLSST